MRFAIIPAVLLSLVTWAGTAAAQRQRGRTGSPASADTQTLQSIDLELSVAAANYQAQDHAGAVQNVNAAIKQVNELLAATAADQRPERLRSLGSIVGRIRKAHLLLQLEGIPLAPLRLDDGTDWLQTFDQPAVAATPDVSGPATPPTPSPASTPTPSPMMNDPVAQQPIAQQPIGTAVSFTREIAPILLANCNGCHLQTPRVRGGLNLDTFAGLLGGGDSGNAIDPGAAVDSLLVQRIKGMSGDRMPGGGRPPLSSQQIELITRWIDEGARYDGGSTDTPLEQASEMAWLSAASPDDISRRRAQQAAADMRTVVGDESIVTHTSKYFLVIGPLPETRLQRIGQMADQQTDVVAGIIPPRGEDAQPRDYFGGTATLMVFPRRYDYAEFARMIERRGVPEAWTGHHRREGVLAYVAIVAADDDAEIKLRLASPLISLAMASRGGDVPQWFARGVGESIANQQVRKLDRNERKALDLRLADAARATADAESFLQNKLPADQADDLSVAIAGSLLTGPRRKSFNELVRRLNESAQSSSPETFDRLFESCVGTTPQAYIDAFLAFVSRR